MNCYIYKSSCTFSIMLVVADEASKQKIQIQKCSCLFKNIVTVEPRLSGPRLSGPRLSGLFDYPDFFSGPVFFMNINKL